MRIKNERLKRVHEKMPRKILGYLAQNKKAESIAKLSIGIKIQHPNTVKLVDRLERLKLIKTERSGRIRSVKLTSKGKSVQKALARLERISR